MKIDNNLLKSAEKLYGRSMFETREWPTEDINTLLEVANLLENLDKRGKSIKLLDNKLMLALFFDKSTRTKTSWAGASVRIGGTPVIIDGSTTQVSHGETAEETGTMIGMNAHALGIRHDLIIGEGNRFMRDAHRGITDYLKKSGEDRHVALINLQCDIDHPTQTLSDLCKLKETFPSLDGIKIAVSWAYSPSYAKPLSVPQGLITLLPRFGMDVVLAHPPEYRLMDSCIRYAKKAAKEGSGTFTIVDNMEDAFKDADVVYAKSWGAYDIMLERIEANKNKDTELMEEIEKKMLELNSRYKNWICNEKLMSKTNNAIYMHCLPADIGYEVEPSVFNKYRQFMAEQANKKTYIIAALLATSLADNFYEKIGKIIK